MSVEIRVAEGDDVLRALAPISHYFGSAGTPPADHMESVTRVLPEGRMLAALEGDAIVGGAGAFEFDLTIPGGPVPVSGVTVVGVLPTHRRRGVLRALMRAQLDGVAQRGEPLAILWASEAGIYPRFGYGLASFSGDIEVHRAHSAYASPLEWGGRGRLVPLAEALEPVQDVYDRVAAETPGMLSRTREWWEARLLTDPEWRRSGRGEKACAVLELDGRPEAYALYRLNFSFEGNISTGVTEVVEAVGYLAGRDGRDLEVPPRRRLDAASEGGALAARPSAPPPGRRAQPPALPGRRRHLGAARGRGRRAGRALVRRRGRSS